jgi:hypothetical protein
LLDIRPELFENGSINETLPLNSTYSFIKLTSNTRIRVIDLIKIKPNTQYNLSVNAPYNTGYALFNTNQLYTTVNFFWGNTMTFTTTSTTEYIAILFRKQDQSNITPSEITSINAQLELGNTATTYEPYSYLAIHNPASNDIPIPALNNKTLNEVFVGGQVLSNGDLTSLTNLTNISLTHQIVDGFYKQNETAVNTEHYSSMNLSIQPVNSVLYITSKIIDFNTNPRLIFYNRLSNNSFATVNVAPNISFFTTISSLSSTPSQFIRLYTSTNIFLGDINNYAIWDYVYVYNLTSLGIASLTQTQMDAYFEAWQRNNAGTLLANTFIQHDQNSVPIADLNGKTLDEVFIGGQLLLNPKFDTNLSNWTINAGTVVWENGTAKISVETPLDFRQLNLTLLNANNYYMIHKGYEDNNGSLTFALRNANTAITNIFSQSYTTNPQNYSYIFTTTSNGDNLVIGRGATERLGNVYIDDVYLINLTALGIATLTKSQLDYLFTVWQFNTLNALVARQFIQEA